MKKTKRALSLLIAVIFILGLAAPVSAAPSPTVRKFFQDGKVYGDYPQFGGYDKLNKAIFDDLWLVFNGLNNKLDGGLTRDPGAFSNSAAKNWVVVTHEIEDKADFFVVTVTVKITYSDKPARTIVNKYYVDSRDKSFTNNSDKLDAYEKAGTPATPPATFTPPTPLEQAQALFNKVTALTIQPDATGYVSIKRYAEAAGGELSITNSGAVFMIDDVPLFITIDDAVWNIYPNTNVYAPIYIAGDDILVHASLIYPIYVSKVSIDSRGGILIVPR